MKVAGFTFIRNAIKYDYPVVEAITSVLPICDVFYVALGKSDDNTRNLIERIGDDRIKIIETVWDDSLREGGRVLALETDKAFDAIPSDYHWAFYIQGDECVHEKYLPKIKEAMQRHLYNVKVEGLLFDYVHFYGSYDYVGDSRKWYRKEIRVIRNDKAIRSYRDAQGFRRNGEKLMVAPVDAAIYHYGWVKPPQYQQAKQEYFNKLWHDDNWMHKNVPKVEEFDYANIDSLRTFSGKHPEVMHSRISKQNWKFSFDPTKKKVTVKTGLLSIIEKITGWRPGEYKNYRISK